MGKPRYRCPGCGQENLPALAFYYDKSKPAGKSSYCKDCTRLRQRERRARLAARTDSEMAAARPKSQRCQSCHETKPASEFYNSRSTPNALRYSCRRCSTAAVREWRNNRNKETDQ